MKMEQIMECLLGETKANQDEMKASQEEMKLRIQANQESMWTI
jgi:hypothetical protein